MRANAMASPAPAFSDIEDAAGRLAGLAVETPLVESPRLNERLGGRLLIKAEMLQRTGSFKFRGAYNRMSRIEVRARRRGVVAYSSGNHAQGDGLILIDEVLTPDSSRFWPADTFETGRDQDSFDKQFVRNYLETCDWDKTPPSPELPDDIVAATREKYLDAYRRLTGKEFSA